MWMRSCAICKALLKKPNLDEPVRCCNCGWEWGGEWRDQPVSGSAWPISSISESAALEQRQ